MATWTKAAAPAPKTWDNAASPAVKTWTPPDDLFILWDPVGGAETMALVTIQGTSGNQMDVDSNSAARVTLYGSTIPDSQALPIRSAGLSQAPVTGAVTVTATQVELKAGTTRLTARKQMIVYPPMAGKIYWGPSGVTVATGAPLAAGDPPVVFDFDPSVDVAIYAVNDGTDREVRVVEAK